MPPPLPRSRSTTVAVGTRTVKGVAVVTCVWPSDPGGRRAASQTAKAAVPYDHWPSSQVSVNCRTCADPGEDDGHGFRLPA
jgi:hypothetical protein